MMPVKWRSFGKQYVPTHSEAQSYTSLEVGSSCPSFWGDINIGSAAVTVVGVYELCWGHISLKYLHPPGKAGQKRGGLFGASILLGCQPDFSAAILWSVDEGLRPSPTLGSLPALLTQTGQSSKSLKSQFQMPEVRSNSLTVHWNPEAFRLVSNVRQWNRELACSPGGRFLMKAEEITSSLPHILVLQVKKEDYWSQEQICVCVCMHVCACMCSQTLVHLPLLTSVEVKGWQWAVFLNHLLFESRSPTELGTWCFLLHCLAD